jgi:transcriptional regulator with XRE-family HTH domain
LLGPSRRTTKRVPTADQRFAFAHTLRTALTEARVSGRSLAEALGLSPASVSKWLMGKTTPGPDTLARAEKVVGLEPGSLSRPLGYVLVPPTQSDAPPVSEAVRADPKLGPREQAVLLAVYKELVRQYSTAQSPTPVHPET